MTTTFKDVIASETFKEEAKKWSQGAAAISATTMMFGIYAPHITLGWHWFWFMPVMLLCVSVFMALPLIVMHAHFTAWELKMQKAAQGQSGILGVIRFVKTIWTSLCAIIVALATLQVSIFVSDLLK